VKYAEGGYIVSFNILKLSGAIISGVADVVNATTSVIDKNSPYKCPSCGEHLARFGLPSHIRHIALGSPRCWNCGCQLSARNEVFDGDYVKEAKAVAGDIAESFSKDMRKVSEKIDKITEKNSFRHLGTDIYSDRN